MGKFAGVNGRLVRADEAAVSVRDHGFLYGDGVFETVRVYRGTPFLLDKHLERLFNGTRALEFDNVPDRDAIGQTVRQVIKKNGFEEGVARITVSRGPGLGRMRVVAGIPATVIITYDEIGADLAGLAETGVMVVTVPETRSALVGVKSLNYLPNFLARRQAFKAGAYEALFVDDNGYVTEGSVSNIFAVRDGRVFTPPADGRILPGIARDLVCRLATDEGLNVQQEPVLLNDAYRSSEILLTNSV
ncbi:MAG: aminotransferase class IV, partial [Actinomycetota bacterium]